jgi:hypothetical protein
VLDSIVFGDLHSMYADDYDAFDRDLDYDAFKLEGFA